ncbi:MAG: hypothetical protein OXI43_10850 [Candidatus Poribacteria bacterium]|nr:hypothetical protein [Candidatus Poribacteria bacterium]
MRYIRSVVDYIDSLEAGDTFRRLFSSGLKISGVLTLSVSVLLGIAILYWVGENVPSAMAAAIIVTATVVHFGIAAIMLYWNRANKISELDKESHLTFTPIMSVTCRLTGEISGLFFITLGFSLFICFCFAPILLKSALSEITYRGDFSEVSFTLIVIGTALFIFYVLIGIFSLVFCYIVAEYAGLIGDIATNIKKIEMTLSTDATAITIPESVPSEEVS